MVLLNTIFIYMITALVFPPFFWRRSCRPKREFLCPSRMVLHPVFLHHCRQRMQRCYSRWQIAEHDESHLPRGLRRNVIHRRFDPLGALPQRTCCFWQRALRRLYRRAVRSNSLSSTQSSRQSLLKALAQLRDVEPSDRTKRLDRQQRLVLLGAGCHQKILTETQELGGR